MMKGFYTATTGLINRGNIINTISNNIANSNTVGYKKDDVILKSFGEHITNKLSDSENTAIGSTNSGIVEDQVYTDFEQGQLQSTGNSLDLALEGEGLFTVQLANGDTAYTRNGQFKVDQDGYLTDLQGDKVLSTDGPLNVGTSNFSVTKSGEVFVNNESIGTLDISTPDSTTSLLKQGDLLFKDTNTTAKMAVSTATVRQGYIENSNVDMIKAMSDLMENSRAFQSCGQLVKMMDNVMDKSVNEIARI